MKKPLLAFIALCALLTGCKTLGPDFPATIDVNQSSFDGATEISMSPAFVYRCDEAFCGSDLMMALFWSDRMPPGKLLLTAQVTGLKVIPPEDSLAFNIDGDFISLSSTDIFTDFKRGDRAVLALPKSSRDYLVDRKLIERLIHAREARVKLSVDKRDYVTGLFSSDTLHSVKPAFIEFLARVDGARK